ncbi:MAG: manganese efflux pump [Clostridia bacterium]|nr:manganese efflux pump [Clostridia bacterium]
MNFLEIFLLALGLSADAFSVAVCKGLAEKKFSIKSSIIVGLWFGLFQSLMPATGYFLGSSFVKYIERFDHWVAFILLAIIGANMIRESFSKDEDDADASLSFFVMLPLAVATSIDALAVGVAPLATLGIGIKRLIFCVCVIGVTTFLLSALGVKIGNKFGSKYKSKAEFIGGLILIILGARILVEHIFFK